MILLALSVSFLLCFTANGFNNYTNSKTLSPIYDIHWRVEVENETIFLGLEVKTLGWFGFGIGESTSGSMPGSDMVIISYNAQGVPQVTDRYAVAFEFPPADSCQDWILLSVESDSGTTFAHLQRRLITGDNQDRPFVPGNNKVVYAYGTTPSMSYHSTNRGVSEVSFYENPNDPEPPTPGEYSREYTLGNFEIPPIVTNYICIAHKIPLTEEDEDHHIIQIDPLIDPNGALYTHHMLVHICSNNSESSYVNQYYENAGRCLTPIGNIEAECSSLLFSWAIGMGSLYVPKEAGFRMGWKGTGLRYMIIEMHYDNPNRVSGIVDNSGFRIHYTSNLRRYDAGSLTLGDPFLSFSPIPPGVKSTAYEATCPSQCTQKFPHDLNVFASFSHMHQIGSQIWTTMYRDDELIGNLNRVEFYSYNFQQQTPLNLVIKPGDRLNTHCTYDSTPRTTRTTFGLTSQDEMCMDFIAYYPQIRDTNGGEFAYCGYYYYGQDVTFCGSFSFENVMNVRNPIVSDLADGLNRTFGLPCSP